jgi:hypothetical protein
MIIFLLAFTVNQLVSFRDHVVVDISKQTPDDIATSMVGLFQGIGYIIIGNLYDNVNVPKKLTFYLFVILAMATSTVHISSSC